MAVAITTHAKPVTKSSAITCRGPESGDVPGTFPQYTRPIHDDPDGGAETTDKDHANPTTRDNSVQCDDRRPCRGTVQTPDPAPAENFHVELGLMFWQPTPGIEIQTGEFAARVSGRRFRAGVRARRRALPGVPVRVQDWPQAQVSRLARHVRLQRAGACSRDDLLRRRDLPHHDSGPRRSEMGSVAVRLRMGLRRQRPRPPRVHHRAQAESRHGRPERHRVSFTERPMSRLRSSTSV